MVSNKGLVFYFNFSWVHLFFFSSQYCQHFGSRQKLLTPCRMLLRYQALSCPSVCPSALVSARDAHLSITFWPGKMLPIPRGPARIVPGTAAPPPALPPRPVHRPLTGHALRRKGTVSYPPFWCLFISVARCSFTTMR